MTDLWMISTSYKSTLLVILNHGLLSTYPLYYLLRVNSSGFTGSIYCPSS